MEFLCKTRLNYYDEKVSRATSFDLSFARRSRFYEKLGIEVTNHTIPDYGSCLARHYPGKNPGIIVKAKWPIYSCQQHRETTRNMYNGMSTKEKLMTPKSVSAYSFTGECFRYMTLYKDVYVKSL